MPSRTFTIVCKPRVLTVPGRKSSVHKANDTNRVTYPSGYPGSGAVWETWGQTNLTMESIPGSFSDYD